MRTQTGMSLLLRFLDLLFCILLIGFVLNLHSDSGVVVPAFIEAWGLPVEYMKFYVDVQSFFAVAAVVNWILRYERPFFSEEISFLSLGITWQITAGVYYSIFIRQAPSITMWLYLLLYVFIMNSVLTRNSILQILKVNDEL